MTAPEATPAPAKPKRNKKSISPRDWVRIRILWEEGAVTYADLCKKYGCSYKTFERHFKEHGTIKGSKAKALETAARAKAEKELAGDIADSATIMAARIKETKEDHYKMSSAVARLAWNEILEAKKAGLPVSTRLNNLKALDAAATVLKKTREERFAILGLDRIDAVDAETIPELVIKELTADQIEALRKRDHLEGEDNPAVNHDAAVAAGMAMGTSPDDDDEDVHVEGDE